MSWLDKIRTDLIIVTGDGKEYRPAWLPGEKDVEYNIASFDFPEIEGTLVHRSKRKGRKIPMQLFFQGENHIDASNAFEQSANDSRAWTVTHPYYGRLIVQPASLNINNTAYNVSEIKVELLETITDEYPRASFAPQDKIANDVVTSNEIAAEVCVEEITAKGAPPLTINKTEVFLVKSDSSVQKIINQQSDTQDYYNNFNQAQAAVQDLTTDPLTAMQFSQAAISAPATFDASVTQRFAILNEQIAALNSSMLSGVTDLIDKSIYQTFGNTLLSALCLSASTPRAGDYANRTDVLITISVLLTAYNAHMTTLDGLQTDDNGNIDSFIPDVQAQTDLNNLVNYTITNLFDIALSARQERSIILEKDSNWILLAHRFYGLDVNDTTVDDMIKFNNAGLSEMLQVKKNRKIIYYV